MLLTGRWQKVLLFKKPSVESENTPPQKSCHFLSSRCWLMTAMALDWGLCCLWGSPPAFAICLSSSLEWWGVSDFSLLVLSELRMAARRHKFVNVAHMTLIHRLQAETTRIFWVMSQTRDWNIWELLSGFMSLCAGKNLLMSGMRGRCCPFAILFTAAIWGARRRPQVLMSSSSGSRERGQTTSPTHPRVCMQTAAWKTNLPHTHTHTPTEQTHTHIHTARASHSGDPSIRFLNFKLY